MSIKQGLSVFFFGHMGKADSKKANRPRVNLIPIHHIATTAACGPVLEMEVHKIVAWKDMYGQEFTQTNVIEAE